MMPYILAILFTLFVALFIVWRSLIWMPGVSFRGDYAPLNEDELQIRHSLQQDLTVLAEEIGERNVSHRYEQYIEAAEFIERSLQAAGHETRRQEIQVDDKVVWNVDVQCTGSRHPDEVIVVGAHYDTVPGSPGANDNGSAVVANLALARMFSDLRTERTIRFAFFVNEESPYYMTETMGSLRYAQACQERDEKVVGMIALETIGCYLDEPGSQQYPVKALGYIYPSSGNFAAFVGNLESRRFVRQAIRGFRRVNFPSEGLAAPRWLKDIFRSDHAAFWHCGFPALMLTDTANFRYKYYHTSEDTVDKINFDALARVVSGVKESLLELAGGD